MEIESGPGNSTQRYLNLLRDPRDNHAYEALKSRFRGFAIQLTRRFGLDASESDALLQEMLVAVFNTFRKGKFVRGHRGQFHRWIHVILVNAANRVSKEQADRNAKITVSATQAAALADPEDDPAEQLGGQELEGMLRCEQAAAEERVKARVETRTWDAFRLVQDGCGYCEVASRLKLEPTAVRQARSRVGVMLREELRDLIRHKMPALFKELCGDNGPVA